VPEPHIGSTSGPPAAWIVGQCARISIAQARVSRIGASPLPRRQPRSCSGAPARSIETMARPWRSATCTRRSASCGSTSGRAPVSARKRSTIASLAFCAVNTLLMSPVLRPTASTAKVRPGAKCCFQSIACTPAYNSAASLAGNSASGSSTRLASRDHRQAR